MSAAGPIFPAASSGEIWPGIDLFRDLAAQHRVVPVVVRYVADGTTPIEIYRKLAANRPGTFLLESATNGEWARYSFIGAGSRATLTTRAGEAAWIGDPPAGLPEGGDPMIALQRSIAEMAAPRLAGLPPFTGGMVGYVGYDAVRRWETLPSENPDELGVPELSMLLASDVAAYDHDDQSVLLIANAINGDGSPERVDEAYAEACARLDSMTRRLAEPSGSTLTWFAEAETAQNVRSRTPQHDFERTVKEIIGDIVDGEAFQVVLSQRFSVEVTADALDVYRVLRRLNPSPYMYLLRTSDGVGMPLDVVGASPEALVTVAGGVATMHPIAGSRPRGRDPEADARLADELNADPKENAEHLMLVDLARNDMQKFCRAGTVTVVELLRIERFSHIMHLVSTVVGDLSPGANAYDALAATFPAGTLSGAPKPRAMRIIDRTEPVQRGIYGGTVGYLDFAGSMDMAIAIRTAVIKDGVATIQAGAGIVADSDPTAEHEETEAKAAAVLRAIAMAEGMHTIRGKS